MNIVIFGLTITSSWGNGHATIWRSLIKALVKKGHSVTFFEKNVSYYADQRDLNSFPGTDIILYKQWDEILPKAKHCITESDAAIVTSYCPDGIRASEEIFRSATAKIFYDLDTPVTLKNLNDGKKLSYIHPGGLGGFDIVLSYTGGKVLDELKQRLGAQFVVPLYGCIDPEIYFPVPPKEKFKCDLSYLGTYSEDRQEKLENLLINSAKQVTGKKFIVAGSMYPAEMFWPGNVKTIFHVAPPEHNYFYCSSRFTLNITRGAMSANGFCPSGRLFEAAACGVPIISDYWNGLENFFIPGKEILIAQSHHDVIDALNLSDSEKQQIALAARRRTINEHSSDRRAEQFENIIETMFELKSNGENNVGHNTGSGNRKQNSAAGLL